jgi:hypothetical protein
MIHFTVAGESASLLAPPRRTFRIAAPDHITLSDWTSRHELRDIFSRHRLMELCVKGDSQWARRVISSENRRAAEAIPVVSVVRSGQERMFSSEDAEELHAGEGETGVLRTPRLYLDDPQEPERAPHTRDFVCGPALRMISSCIACQCAPSSCHPDGPAHQCVARNEEHELDPLEWAVREG